jgi:hypothetical protein
MSPSDPQSNELGRNLALWSVVGAIVGAGVGGLGFSDKGINVQAALIGLLAGAVVFSVVALLVTVTVAKASPRVLQLLGGAFGGWLFAGVIWELQFERKLSAQFAGLGIGLLLTLVLVNRDWLAKTIRGQRDTSAAAKPEENRSS